MSQIFDFDGKRNTGMQGGMKLKKRMAYLLCVALLIFCGYSACVQKRKEAVPEFVLTYGENQAEDYPTTQGGLRFAELVKERTDGKVIIQMKCGGVLGEEPSVVQQARFGGVDFVRISLASVSDMLPQLNVIQMPYLYKNSEHMWKVLDGEIGEKFLETFKDAGLVALSWYDAGTRSFYSSQKPIQSPEDMEGMVVRVQDSELMYDVITALGAKPYSNAFSEVYSAFETKIIDAAENNWPSYESTKHYEVAKYFTLDEHTRVPEVQIVSEQTWNKLPEEYQNIIRECAEESAEYERELWKEREETARKHAIEEGCQEIHLSEDKLKEFQTLVAPVYEKYCADYMDILEEIRQADE